jgi:hypothetical protein
MNYKFVFDVTLLPQGSSKQAEVVVYTGAFSEHHKEAKVTHFAILNDTKATPLTEVNVGKAECGKDVQELPYHETVDIVSSEVSVDTVSNNHGVINRSESRRDNRFRLTKQG